MDSGIIIMQWPVQEQAIQPVRWKTLVEQWRWNLPTHSIRGFISNYSPVDSGTGIWELAMDMKDREMVWEIVAVSVCFSICVVQDAVAYRVKDRLR